MISGYISQLRICSSAVTAAHAVDTVATAAAAAL